MHTTEITEINVTMRPQLIGPLEGGLYEISAGGGVFYDTYDDCLGGESATSATTTPLTSNSYLVIFPGGSIAVSAAYQSLQAAQRYRKPYQSINPYAGRETEGGSYARLTLRRVEPGNK